MKADGHSQAAPYRTDGGSLGSITWSISGSSASASIDGNGRITAGTVPGTVRVTGTDGATCYEMLLDVTDCDGCQSGSCPAPGAPGVSSPGLGSIDYRLKLGWALSGGTAGFLQIKESAPGPLLATPQTLQYNFIRMDARKITDNFGLRQVRTPDCLADIVTNSAFAYRIDLYSYTDLYNYNGSLYTVKAGAVPFQTVVVTNLNNDTNKLRIIETRAGSDTIYDYSWVTNGGELVSGGGVRKEVKTESFSETNTLRTTTYQIKDAGGAVLYQRIEKWRTNTTYGERLIEQATGTGPNALTNSFTWTSTGRPLQTMRSDGSWEYVVYDSSDRPTNVFSSYRNQSVTTDKSLCRFVEHSYATNMLSGSGDAGYLSTTTPRQTVEYLLGQEVGRRYQVVLPGERREIQCVTPGAAWDNSSNLVTITRLSTNTFYFNEPTSILRPDGTIEIIQIASPKIFANYATVTNVVLSGHPNDANGTNIDHGTKTVSIIDWRGNLLSKTVLDVPSGLTLASESYKYDGFKRLTNTLYLDGTSASSVYQDCCSASFSIDREGTHPEDECKPPAKDIHC